jgi:4-amino-4-deoxy-L-arabinose transferase-like glycosyltransferase
MATVNQEWAIEGQPARSLVQVANEFVREHYWQLLVLAATIIAALVRLPTLGSQALWDDELISVNIAKEPIGEIMRARLHIGADRALVDRLYTNNPPLHLLLIHAVRAVSTSDGAIRFPFALAGIGAIPVAYLMLRMLVGVRVAGLAALLLSLSQVNITYSQEARPSSLLLFFSMCALLYLLRALDDNRRLDWSLFALFLLLDCWSSYFALILVMPTLAVIAGVRLLGMWRESGGIWPQRLLFPAVAAFAVVCAGCVPLIPDVRYVAHQNDVSGVKLGLVQFLLTVNVESILLVAPNLGTLDNATRFIPHLFTLIGLTQLVVRRRAPLLLAFCWILVPTTLLLIVSTSHFLHPKYLLFITPMLLASMVLGIDYLVRPLCRIASGKAQTAATAALVGLIVAAYGFGVVSYERGYSYGGAKKTDWRSVAQLYEQNSDSNSCLILVDREAIAATRAIPYYLASETSKCFVDVRDPSLLRDLDAHPDLWWVVEERQTDVGSQDLNRLASVFSETHDQWRFHGVLVLHARASSVQQQSQATAELMLTNMINAIQPVLGAGDQEACAARQGLANLLALQGSPEQAVLLVQGSDAQEVSHESYGWRYAEREIERRNYDGARWWAIRIVAVFPGSPDGYDLLAEIESREGSPSAQTYQSIAALLRSSEGD